MDGDGDVEWIDEWVINPVDGVLILFVHFVGSGFSFNLVFFN